MYVNIEMFPCNFIHYFHAITGVCVCVRVSFLQTSIRNNIHRHAAAGHLMGDIRSLR